MVASGLARRVGMMFVTRGTWCLSNSHNDKLVVNVDGDVLAVSFFVQLLHVVITMRRQGEKASDVKFRVLFCISTVIKLSQFVYYVLA